MEKIYQASFQIADAVGQSRSYSISNTNPIGRSDGRCVHRTGTYSTLYFKPCLLDIPGSQKDQKFQKSIPITTRPCSFFKTLVQRNLWARSIVTRVHLRSSRGITDLLLPRASTTCVRCSSPSKKLSTYSLPKPCLVDEDLVRYLNRLDRSTHQLKAAMHHHSKNQERAANLSIISMSGSDKFSRVESN